MKRTVYPVEYDPLLRVFNNQLSFYQFLAQYNPEINVGLSALLPPTEFVIGSVHYPCRTIVDFFEKIAKHTGLPIDTGISTIRMGVILLFFTENLDESTLTLQSGDVNITLTPSVFKEVDAAFKVSVAEGHLWDPVGMPKKVTINDEQCNIVYEEDTQTFTIELPKTPAVINKILEVGGFDERFDEDMDQEELMKLLGQDTSRAGDGMAAGSTGNGTSKISSTRDNSISNMEN